MEAAFPDDRVRADQAACPSPLGRVVVQKVWTVVRPDRRDQIAAGMCVPGRVAENAWAAPDAGHWDAILDLRQEVVRDCPSAMSVQERLVLPQCRVSMDRRREQKWYPAQQPPDASLKAAHRLVPQVVELQQVAPQCGPLALQQELSDESALPQAQSLAARRASHSAAALQVHGAAP